MLVIHHFDARQARDFAFGFFAHKRQERQRVCVRAPDVGVVHHHQVKVQVFHVRRQRGCGGHDDAGMRAFLGGESDDFGVVVQHQLVHQDAVAFKNGHGLRRRHVVFEGVRFDAGIRNGDRAAPRKHAVFDQLYHDLQIGHEVGG